MVFRFELSLVSVNLAYHLVNGSGRMNATYMDEQNEFMMVCFPEFGGGYREIGPLRKKNCYPQQEGIRLIHTVLPFWAFRSKEKVGIRGHYYTSYLEGVVRPFTWTRMSCSTRTATYISHSPTCAKPAHRPVGILKGKAIVKPFGRFGS